MKRSIKIFLLALFVAVAAMASANNPISVVGQIVNTKTKGSIPFINVMIKGTTIGAITDAEGKFILKNIPKGHHTLIASGVGFRKVEQHLDAFGSKPIELKIETEEENISMDEVVVSANRNERNKKEAPIIVSIINPKVFETTNSNNLSQGLNFQAGVRVENSCQNCGFPQVRINGLDGQYSQILIDSRPIFSSLSGVYGLEQLPTNMVERVEITRGGGSALYGSNAVGGIINIITKEPTRNLFSIANNTMLMDMKTPDVNTMLNASLVSNDFKSGMYIFGMVRNRNHFDKDGDGFSELGENKANTIGFRGYHKTSDFSKITVEYHNLNEYRRGGNAFDLPPHLADIAEQTQYYTNGGGVKFDLLGKDLKQRLNLYSSFQHNKRSSYYGAGKDPNAYGNSKDLTWVGGAQYTKTFDKLIFMPSELTAGAEYNFNHLEDDAPGYNRFTDQKAKISSVFLQNEWTTKKLGILVGARLDKHNMVKDAIISPRINLRYNPSSIFNFRATYSSGFRAPQTYDEDLHILAVSGEVALISNDPNLKPEKSHSYSASVDIYPNLGGIKTNFLVEGFYTTLNDKFEIVESGSDADGNILRKRVNGPGAYVTGVNVEAKAVFSHRFDIQMGYTQQQSRYEKPFDWSGAGVLKPQRKMFRTPDSYGFFSANYELTEDFVTSLSGTYTGPMLVQHNIGTVDPNDSSKTIKTFAEKTTPSFFDMGIKLAYTLKISKEVNLQLNAGMQNIFDSYQKDFDKGSLRDAKYVYGPALPRTLTFGAKIFL